MRVGDGFLMIAGLKGLNKLQKCKMRLEKESEERELSLFFFLYNIVFKSYLQLYQSRKKYLRAPKEERRCLEISFEFMTEESEASDGERINKHSLPWRSESTSCIFSILIHV